MKTQAMLHNYQISERAERGIKRSAVIVMIVVALSSAILSFDGLQKIALDAQIPGHLAFLFPIAVDFTILMGSLSVLRFKLVGAPAFFGWATVLLGTALSIAGNVLSVRDAGWIAQAVHGLVPVLLCLSLESLLQILRFTIKRGQEESSTPAVAVVEPPRAEATPAPSEAPVVAETVESLPLASEATVEESVEFIANSVPVESVPAFGNEAIASYKALIADLPTSTNRSQKILAILREHPQAKVEDIREALDENDASVDYERIVEKARAYLAKKGLITA